MSLRSLKPRRTTLRERSGTRTNKLNSGIGEGLGEIREERNDRFLNSVY